MLLYPKHSAATCGGPRVELLTVPRPEPEVGFRAPKVLPQNKIHQDCAVIT